MSKNINGPITQFEYNGLNPVQELDGANPANVTANLLTGLEVDELFQRTDIGGPLNFMTDTIGSALALADSTGTLQTQYTYEPLGNTSIAGANINPYQFTGRENDGTGLYFYRARYYKATFQRFIAQDPLGFGGGDANLYVYASNDPVDHRDSTGQGFWTGLAVGAACFGYFGYELVSSLRELSQEEALTHETNQLTQQRNSCRDPDQQLVLQHKVDILEQKKQTLVLQYIAGAPSFSHDAEIAACLVVTRLAFYAPPPVP